MAVGRTAVNKLSATRQTKVRSNVARNRGGQQQQGQKRQQGDPRRGMNIGTAKKYATALINQDENTLNKMTLHTSGSIGSGKSNITAFRNAGASKVSGVQSNGKKATVLFSDDEEVKCVGIFTVVDQEHILGDWELFQKA